MTSAMVQRTRVYSRRPRLWRRTEGGTFYIVWNEHGQTKKLSTRTSLRAPAEEALREFLAHQDSGTSADLPVSLHQAVEDWLHDRERPRHALAASTLGGYRSWAALFQRSFPSRILAKDVTPALIRNFLDKQEDAGIAPLTLRKYLGGLCMVYEFLIREGHVARNPCKAIRLTAQSNRHPAMTEEEFAQLRAAFDQELQEAEQPQSKRDAQELLDLADVLWNSGLRFIEATRLTWKDIDLQKAQWVIRSPKNKGGVQTLPLHHSLVPVLRRRHLLGGTGPFTGYWPLQRLWVAFKDRHPEFTGWSWHRMRHAFVTRLRKAGRDAAAVALARHKSSQMSDHYTHLDLTDLRKDLEAL